MREGEKKARRGGGKTAAVGGNRAAKHRRLAGGAPVRRVAAGGLRLVPCRAVMHGMILCERRRGGQREACEDGETNRHVLLLTMDHGMDVQNQVRRPATMLQPP